MRRGKARHSRTQVAGKRPWTGPLTSFAVVGLALASAAMAELVFGLLLP
jgi:hypothetical protein